MRSQVKLLKTIEIWPNTGQIHGLPKNPRFIKDEKFQKLVQSVKDDPEMLHLREIIVYPYAGQYVSIGGNMRLRACVEANILEVPCKILPEDTPVEKLKAYVIKDNIGYGSNDWDALANDWDDSQLIEWGMDLPILGDFEEENEKEENSNTIETEGDNTSQDMFLFTVEAETEESLKIARQVVENALSVMDGVQVKG